MNDEDSRTFIPSPGKIITWHTPGGLGVRVDSHAYSKYVVHPHYDSMIGKIIVFGKSRKQALSKMKVALSEMVVEGISTNIPLHRILFEDPEINRGGVHINYLESKLNNSEA